MKKFIVIISAFCCMILTYITGCCKESTTGQIVEQKPKPARKLDYEPKNQINLNLESQTEKNFPMKEDKRAEKDNLNTALKKAAQEAKEDK